MGGDSVRDVACCFGSGTWDALPPGRLDLHQSGRHWVQRRIPSRSMLRSGPRTPWRYQIFAQPLPGAQMKGSLSGVSPVGAGLVLLNPGTMPRWECARARDQGFQGEYQALAATWCVRRGKRRRHAAERRSIPTSSLRRSSPTTSLLGARCPFVFFPPCRPRYSPPALPPQFELIHPSGSSSIRIDQSHACFSIRAGRHRFGPFSDSGLPTTFLPRSRY